MEICYERRRDYIQSDGHPDLMQLLETTKASFAEDDSHGEEKVRCQRTTVRAVMRTSKGKKRRGKKERTRR